MYTLDTKCLENLQISPDKKWLKDTIKPGTKRLKINAITLGTKWLKNRLKSENYFDNTLRKMAEKN